METATSGKFKFEMDAPKKKLEELEEDWKAVNKEFAFLYYRTWRTASEMLFDRNYEIDPNNFDISYHEFLERFGIKEIRNEIPAGNQQMARDRFQIISTHKSDSGNKVLVTFLGDYPVDYAAVCRLFRSCLAADLRRVIVMMHSCNFTKEDRQLISHACPVKMEFFSIFGFSMNKLRELIPRCELVTQEEKILLFRQHKKISRLSIDGSISRYYGYEVGAIVKMCTTPCEVEGNNRMEGNATRYYYVDGSPMQPMCGSTPCFSVACANISRLSIDGSISRYYGYEVGAIVKMCTTPCEVEGNNRMEGNATRYYYVDGSPVTLV